MLENIHRLEIALYSIIKIMKMCKAFFSSTRNYVKYSVIRHLSPTFTVHWQCAFLPRKRKALSSQRAQKPLRESRALEDMALPSTAVPRQDTVSWDDCVSMKWSILKYMHWHRFFGIKVPSLELEKTHLCLGVYHLPILMSFNFLRSK